jgi:hypothetical protein
MERAFNKAVKARTAVTAQATWNAQQQPLCFSYFQVTKIGNCLSKGYTLTYFPSLLIVKKNNIRMGLEMPQKNL